MSHPTKTLAPVPGVIALSEKKPFESFVGPDESTRIMSALHHRISESCSARRSPRSRSGSTAFARSLRAS